MKNIMLVASVLLMTVSPMGWARGIFVTPGTKANALGAAFVAIADDPSAIYWNPAGLAQLKGSGVQVSAVYAAASVDSNHSLRNVAAPDPDDGDFPLSKIYDAVATGGLLPTTEPSEYNRKDFELIAAIPFLAGYYEVNGSVFAIGYYGAAGGGGLWKNTVSDIAGLGDSISAKVDAQYYMMVYNFSAARQLNDRWSIGAGLDMVSMIDKATVSKDYAAGAASPMGSYSMANRKDASGNGIQANIGLTYKPAPQWRTGVVYRSGATIKLSGKQTFNASGLAAFGLGDFESAYDQNYYYPETYSLGAAYDPSEQWTVSVAAMHNSYSRSRMNITYTNPNAALGMSDSDVSQNYNDTTQLCLGSEYRHNESWTFRAGAYTDPVQVPTEKLTLINSSQFNVIYGIIGAEYTKGPLTLNLGLGRGISDTPSKDGRNYTYTSNIVRCEAQYAF